MVQCTRSGAGRVGIAYTERMDRITKSLLDEFVSQNDLVSLPEDQQFERFCGFLAVSSHSQESVDTGDITVGAGGDSGFDCLAVIANGAIVTEADEVDDMVEKNGYLDVMFVFVQAERSSSFDASKVANFGYGVKDFFSETPSLVQNDAVKNLAGVTGRVFHFSSKFKKGNPACYLYYSTTGKWVDDQNLAARIKAVADDLKALNLFRTVEFQPVDADGIRRLYSGSKNAISRDVQFPRRTAMPAIPNVDEAYVGLLSGSEFLKLIENDEGEILPSLFYDNVRHWMEWNAVNKEIRETLDSDTTRSRFPLMNNGVTIVAKAIRPAGDKFTVEDYQIVNGCQTSFVLHEARDRIQSDSGVLVPVRLIATRDEEVKNAIIKATNRQTEVTEDQLFALSDFPKKLEAYFPSFDGRKRLYYERRPRQYAASDTVEKVRVVGQTAVIRAFASIFLERPHGTTRNYKNLLRQIGVEIFNKDHVLDPYYVAAYAHYRLEYLFRRQFLTSDLKPARYHLLLGARFKILQRALPRMNSNEMRRYCDEVLQVLWDDDRSARIFQDVGQEIREVASNRLNRDDIRTEDFTKKVIARWVPARP